MEGRRHAALGAALGILGGLASAQPTNALPGLTAPTPITAALARAFEPVLRFDSSERWRPLNVYDFFAERRNQICRPSAVPICAPISSAANLPNDPTAYIKVYPGNYRVPGDEVNYRSPYVECSGRWLRDCDVGPHSAIFWGVNDPTVPSSYAFVDYWIFYRANYFDGPIDWHEGDWENVSVAPSPSGISFDYASFSQHGGDYSYLKDVLRCENVPAVEVPPAGTCIGAGRRIDVMVANGDHANYATPCTEQRPIEWCQQNGTPIPALPFLHPERGYDGQARWGRAFFDPSPATALLPLPTGRGSWTSWPGSWGSPKPTSWPGRWFEGNGPPSPGMQSYRFKCATLNNGPGCLVAAPRGPTVGAPPGGYQSPALAALACGSWIGPGVSAAVCDPAALDDAILHRRLGVRGGTTISVDNKPGRSISAPGITQFTTAKPLAQHDRIRISGHPTSGATLLVRRAAGPDHKPVVTQFRLQGRRVFAN